MDLLFLLKLELLCNLRETVLTTVPKVKAQGINFQRGFHFKEK